MIIYSINNLPKALTIGKQTETGVTQIGFDCAEWLSNWSNLALSAMVTPPGGEAAYPANTEMDGSVLVWTVNRADTVTSGRGTVEILGIADGLRKLSATIDITILRTTTSTTTEPPEAVKTWFDTVMEGVTGAEGSATRAAESAEEAKNALEDAENTLNSIPADYSTLSEDVSQLKDTITEIVPKDSISFEIGGINTDGTNATSKRVRSSFIAVKAGSVFSIAEGYEFNLATYSYPATKYKADYRGFSDEPYTVTEDCYIRVAIRDEAQTVTWTTDNMSMAIDALDTSNVINVIDKLGAWERSDLEDGYVTTNGSVGSVVSYDVTGSANIKHCIIECETGDVFMVTGAGADKPRIWCFVDENDVILAQSNASSKITKTMLVASKKGKLIVNADTSVSTHPAEVLCRTSVEAVLDETKERVAYLELLNEDMGRYIFGVDIPGKYETPMQDALSVPTNRLAYFYGLYDALMAEYPAYITKVDCDAEVASAGIERPEAMGSYPIYMYKFRPQFTPKATGYDTTETAASVIKVFIVTGTHPEYMAIFDAYQTMRMICEGWKTDDNLAALRWECEIYVMPCSAPYNVQNNSRTNANGVDLNRNMPTSNWAKTVTGNEYSGEYAGSEYETKVLEYYFEQIKPLLFIDHHNTSTADGKNLMYITSRTQTGVDLGANHISAMTRRWKNRFHDTFPHDDVIYGYSKKAITGGTRVIYAHEHGAYGFTFESNPYVFYEDGAYSESYTQYNTALCTTLATDGFVNFLLKALKVLSGKVN